MRPRRHRNDQDRLQSSIYLKGAWNKKVITLLSEEERHVGGLCDQFNMSQPAVSHHLAVLRLGGIVDRRRQGKNNFYSLTDTGYRLSNIVKGVVR